LPLLLVVFSPADDGVELSLPATCVREWELLLFGKGTAVGSSSAGVVGLPAVPAGEVPALPVVLSLVPTPEPPVVAVPPGLARLAGVRGRTPVCGSAAPALVLPGEGALRDDPAGPVVVLPLVGPTCGATPELPPGVAAGPAICATTMPGSARVFAGFAATPLVVSIKVHEHIAKRIRLSLIGYMVAPPKLVCLNPVAVLLRHGSTRSRLRPVPGRRFTIW